MLLPSTGLAEARITTVGPTVRPVVEGDEALASTLAAQFFSLCIDRSPPPEQLAQARGWTSFDPVFHPIAPESLRLEETNEVFTGLLMGRPTDSAPIGRSVEMASDRKAQLRSLQRRAWSVPTPAGELLVQRMTAPANGKAPAIDVCSVAAVGVDEESFISAKPPKAVRRKNDDVALFVSVGRLRDWRASLPLVRMEEPEKRGPWRPKQARWRTQPRPYEPTSPPPASVTRTGEPYLAVSTTL